MGLDIFFNKRNKSNDRTAELAYFRKVNFLVKFMENYGFNSDTDNCKYFPLTKEMIQDLYDRCKEIMMVHLEDNQRKFEEKAHALLPTCSGFFFGSTDYNDWYYNDVKDVKKEMKKILTAFDKLKPNEEIVFHIWY